MTNGRGAAQTLGPGALLGGRYLVEREIARGGIGVVYFARDRQILSRPVVVKALLPQSAEDAWLESKFHQEVEALARISHPGVVQVLDVGQADEGGHYFVMQLVEGEPLRSRLRLGGIPLGEAATIMGQIGQALSAAHEQGVVHRDLKPENVMVRDRGDGQLHVTLIDFGIAKVEASALGQETQSPVRAGTLAYMAPEQIAGRSASVASDVYAMGVIAHELLTGRLPVDAIGARALRRDLPAPAESALLRALSPDPAARPRSARALGDELAAALTGSKLPLAATTREPVALRVVLLGARGSDADEAFLERVEQELCSRGHLVHVDRLPSVGREDGAELERQLAAGDRVVALISPEALAGPWLGRALALARASSVVTIELARPSPEGDETALAALLADLAPAREPPALEAVGGAVPLESRFYVKRDADDAFSAALSRQDSIVLVKGARQMGKTSLLARSLQHVRAAGARVVLTDFQVLGAPDLGSIDAFLRALAGSLADQLDLDVDPALVWNPRRGAVPSFGRFVRQEVLGKVHAPLVWALDEVDRIFPCSFASEVFGLFRSWHNARALDPDAPWRRLTLAMAYATEAHLFITDVNQSPFNVGTRLELEDFTLEQVAELDRRHGSPLGSPSEIRAFVGLVGGHPYLVRRGMHEMVTRGVSVAELERSSAAPDGPFADHLRRMMIALSKDETLVEVVRGVLAGRPCTDTESFYRLRSAGVMSGASATEMRPRCPLYAAFMARQLA